MGAVLTVTTPHQATAACQPRPLLVGLRFISRAQSSWVMPNWPDIVDDCMGFEWQNGRFKSLM